MSLVKLSLAAVLLAVQAVWADHQVTFKNSCPFALQPMWKGNNDGASAHKTSSPIPAGSSATATLPEIWNSGRIFAQDPKKSCAEPDGGDCTLLECSFGPSSNGQRWWQCNISLVSGYNVPASLKFVGGKEDSCKVGFSCLSGSCPMSQAYRVEGCTNCINQCNTDNVGLAIEFCQAGSSVPDMGQGSTKPTTPVTADPKPVPSQPPSRPIPTATAATTKPAAQPTSPATQLSAPVNLAPAPTATSTKHCSRARRRARRAHKRALLAHAASH